MIGQIVSHYRILEKLGSGGMSVVYRAEDLRLGRPTALKFLPAEVGEDPVMVERFRREARAASALNHPNICTIYEIYEHQGEHFIAMELLEGETLGRRIGRGSIEIGQLLDWGVQISDALRVAHAEGIIHRDVKPANIFITDRGQAKVLDFGLAKLLRHKPGLGDASTASGRSSEEESLTPREMPLGTLPYMSPEQARGETVDARTDVFSLGAVLYEMATGEKAFGGGTPALTLDAVLNRTPSPATQLNPQVPAGLDRIIRKALEKDRETRFASATVLNRELSRLRREMESGSRSWVSLKLGRGLRSLPFSSRRSSAGAFAVGSLIVAGIVALLLSLNPRGLRDRVLGGGGSHAIDSLAVLPLHNLSGDSEQDYFADGMTEALITSLAQISALRVISRTSVMQYKGTREPPRDIARALDVDVLVEGSVLRSGNRVRISAQLIDAETEQYIWASSYERDASDILMLQGEVAQAVAHEIRINLSSGERALLAGARQVKPEAHEAYLKGRYHWNRKTGEGFEKAVENFQQATAIDPGYARGYAGLADTYNMLVAHGILPPKEGYPKAKKAAVRALELDEALAEAHTSLASIMENYDWDWAGAEEQYQRAIDINPGYATAHEWYASFLRNMGRHEEAVEEIHRAVELDPLSLPIRSTFGGILIFGRRYDEAIEQYRKLRELDPRFDPYGLGDAFLNKGMVDEAIAEFEGGPGASDRNPESLLGLGRSLAMAGRKAEGRKVLHELLEVAGRKYVSPYKIARVYVAVGDLDEAMRRLAEAYEERNPNMVWLRADPGLDPLRPNPRFQDLLRRMNFPE